MKTLNDDIIKDHGGKPYRVNGQRTMKPLIFGLIFCTTAFSISLRSDPLIKNNDQYRIFDEIKNALAANGVKRIDVVYYPTNILTRVAITPQWLDRNYQYRITIRNNAASKTSTELKKKLDALNPRKTLNVPDVRWGVIFYDIDEKRIGGVYLDGLGESGFIEKSPVAVSSGFQMWLNHAYTSSFN